MGEENESIRIYPITVDFFNCFIFFNKTYGLSASDRTFFI